MREIREYDDTSENLERKSRRLTPEERDAIIREFNDEYFQLRPRLGKESENKFNLQEGDFKSKIESDDEFREVLRRNPSFMERMDAEKELLEISGYFRLMEDKKTGNVPKQLQRRELAEYYGIPDSSYNDWSSERTRPFGIKILERIERDRVRYTQKIPKEAKEHLVDSPLVYHSMKKLRFESLDCHQVASTIIELEEQIPRDVRVYSASLKPYSVQGMQWYRRISDYISRNLMEIQKELETRTLRIGLIDDTIFVHRFEPSADNWTNIHAADHFHFKDSESKNKIVDEALLRLGGISRQNLGRLLNQFADISTDATQKIDRYEIRRSSKHLRGATFGFILDVTGKDIREIQSIKHIVGFGTKRGRGRIENPEFPQEVDKVRAQLFGALMSDGHLRPKMSVHYYEKDLVRVKRFKEIIHQLGTVHYWETKRDDGYVIGLPSVIGRMLLKWGMPIGDKNILNSDLPDIIKEGTNRIKQEYLRQMIAEDGSFSFKGGGWRFKWSRAVTLYSTKMEDYGVEPRISDFEQQFIIRHGKRKTTDFKNPHSNEGSIEQIIITKGRLDELLSDSDSEIITESHSFQRMIIENTSNLLECEKKIAESLGINVVRRWDKIVLYPETGKISLLWSCTTRKNRDAAIWAKIAPPDHERKMRSIKEAIEWGLFERHLPDEFKE